MSGSVNKAILVGNLGADPEVRNLPSGGKVVNLSIATSESWKDKSTGEKRERTDWHRVVIFNEGLAGIAEQYLRKGSKVYLEGQIQTRKWQDQSGTDKYSTEIVLQGFGATLALLDRQEGGGNRPPPATSPDDYGRTSSSNAPSHGGGGSGGGNMGGMDDDIPFSCQVD